MGSIYNPFPPDLVGRCIFGNATAGSPPYVGANVITLDYYYNNLTINAGVTLWAQNCRIFVRNTLLNNGLIHNNGVNGGVGLVAAGGSGGIAPASVSLVKGGDGGNGGAPLNAGSPGGNNTNGLCSNGGAGGMGDAEAGGIAGALAFPPAGFEEPYDYVSTIQQTSVNSGAIIRYSASAGGGGGGGDPLTGGGGGGGSAAGTLVICARRVINNGIISANGGAGGNGYALPSAGAGGGGGGGGGLIVLIYNYFTGNTPQVLGGAGGLGTGTGMNGDDAPAGLYRPFTNVN